MQIRADRNLWKSRSNRQMNGSTPHWSVIPLSIRLRQLHPVLKLRRAEQVFCKEFSVCMGDNAHYACFYI